MTKEKEVLQGAPSARTASKMWEADFKRLAEEDYYELLRLIGGGNLDDVQLTFAAEAAGYAILHAEAAVKRTLFKVLEHPQSIVREGAIYGLNGILEVAGVREKLAEVAKSDASPTIREIASESLT